MSPQIPIFPLQLVIYPGEDLNLHIFEPRYKQLINFCIEAHQSFGIPPYFDEQIQSLGTLVSIDKVHKTYEDGRMDISVRGKSIFTLHEILQPYEDKLFSGATIKDYPVSYADNGQLQEELRSLLLQLFEALQIHKKLPVTDQLTAYQVAHIAGMVLEQEYELLQIREEMERQQYLIDHLQSLMPSAKKMQQIRQKALMNGHFREFGPLEF